MEYLDTYQKHKAMPVVGSDQMWSWRCLFPWTKAPQNRLVFHYIIFLMTMSNDTHFFRWIILGIPIYRYTLSFLSKPEQASTSRKQTTRLESNNAPYSRYTRFHHFWGRQQLQVYHWTNSLAVRIYWLCLWSKFGYPKNWMVNTVENPIINLPFGDGLPMVYQ
jgi:hypothetical protein